MDSLDGGLGCNVGVEEYVQIRRGWVDCWALLMRVCESELEDKGSLYGGGVREQFDGEKEEAESNLELI